jgi:hypothetical protein
MKAIVYMFSAHVKENQAAAVPSGSVHVKARDGNGWGSGRVEQKPDP